MAEASPGSGTRFRTGFFMAGDFAPEDVKDDDGPF
jgi:hypothetical protein